MNLFYMHILHFRGDPSNPSLGDQTAPQHLQPGSPTSRSMILRRLMGVAGIPVPPSPVRPSRGSNDDSSNESEESSSTSESDDGSESAGEVPDDHGGNDGSGADGEIKAEGGGDEVKEEANPLPNPDLKVPSKEAGEVSRSTPGSTGSGGDKASASGSASSGSPRVSGLHTYSFFCNINFQNIYIYIYSKM